MTSLGMRRCRPLISPLVAGTKPVYPLDAGPGVHDEDMASLPRASATWLAPGCRPHRGAAPQLRFVVGRYAATAARYAARRLVPRSGTTSWPRRGLGAAAYDVVPLRRHRYGVLVQSLFKFL